LGVFDLAIWVVDVELDDSLMVALPWVGPQLKTFW
jgi:hypothetical protein